MKAVLAGKTGTPTDGMAEGDQVTRTSATELVQNLDVSALDGDTAKALLNKILTSLEDVAKMKSSTTAAEEQNHPKSGSSSPPDEVRRASEILLGMRGVDQSNAASCEDTANIENRNQTGKNETNVPTSSDDLASRTKSAISTLADLCTALRDVEPQVVNEVLPRRYHHLVPSPSAPTLEVQAVAVPGPKASSERTVGTEPPTLPSPAAVPQVPSPKRIFIPGKTAIRPMPDYCRVIFHPSSPDMDNRKRRARTVFSAQQLKRLEEEYKKCSYPDKERRQGVADATGLTEGCVRIWYQNRRAKDHRLKDSERQREGMSVSSTSQPEIILSSRPVEPARLPPSDAAPPTTLNRAEEAAMEALVNLSSTTSTETMAAYNPNNTLNSAAQSDEAMADVDTKSSATESKNIVIGGASKCELVEQNNAANNLQLAMEKTEQPQTKQTDHNRDTNSKVIPVADSSAIDKLSCDMRTVEKASGGSSQPKSQRAMIASLVAQTLRHSEGLDYKRTVVPIAVVNIPIVRVEGNTGKGMLDGSEKGSEKMKPVPYVTVATRVPVPNMGDRLGDPKRGDSPPQPTEVVRPATSIGIPFKALQFQNQWTKKSSTLSQRNDCSTTVTAKIQPGVHISNLPRTDAATTRTSTSSSASKVSSFLGFLISDTEASTKQLIGSSTPTIQDAKPSEKGCGIDTGKAKVPSSAIPSAIVLRLQPRPTTVTAKPPTTAETELTKDSEKDMDQPTFIIDDCSSSRALGTTDRKRKVSEAEGVNKDRKVVQTKMWRELTEEKSVAKRTKTATKGSKKSTPSQVIQHSREDNQYGDETQEREIETKEATRGSNTCGEIKQTKLSTTDTNSLTDTCTVTSGGNALNYKNSHPTTLHYKKGRVCQCHQLQEIIDYCVRKGSEAAKKDTDTCSTTKEAGSLQRPREGKEQAGEPSRQVPRSGDSIPKTWASGTVRHLKITTPISIATTGGLVNVRSFTRVPVGSVRAPPVITNTQYAGSFNRPTASFRHVNYSKKPCPIPATVIPKSTPAAGQLFMNNHPKATVQLKAARGVRVVVSHPSNNVTLPPTPVCESAGHSYTTPPTFTRPTVGTVSQHTCGAAAMFRLGSVLKRPNASTCTFRLPLVTKPAQRIPAAATTGYISNGIRFQRIQNRGQLSGQPGAVNRQPPLPQGDGNALRRLQRFTDGFMERHRSTAPSTESRRDDRPPPVKVRRTDM